MRKISVFSRKLNQTIDFVLSPRQELLSASASHPGTAMDNYLFGWNNQSGSWLDNGWNNQSGSWQDGGWNNQSGSWIDSGWNNRSGSWSDSGWNNQSGSWTDGGGGGGGGCFISTACAQYKGLPDDCHELQILRSFRDAMAEQSEELRAMILDYYRKAPIIVKKLNELEDAEARFEALYHNLVERCVHLCETGQVDDAISVYRGIYDSLIEEFHAA
jgi:hypothetical protein